MLKVIKPGFYSSIQDSGRKGYRDFGVPISGAMDTYSSRLANTLLGNDRKCAVLEMTMFGGEFLFSTPSIIAISGAEMHATLNHKPVSNNSSISVESGDVLRFGRASQGFRSYLAIKNGFQSKSVLNSRSQYKSITKSVSLSKDEILHYSEFKQTVIDSNASVKYDQRILTDYILDVFKGPEFNKLPKDQKHLLLNTDFSVSHLNNRMAYQIEPLVPNNIDPIITSPILPGTVQLTPSGRLIILMRDAQTTGGYPRVLQLTEQAINCLSQKTTGNILKIRLKE